MKKKIVLYGMMALLIIGLVSASSMYLGEKYQPLKLLETHSLSVKSNSYLNGNTRIDGGLDLGNSVVVFDNPCGSWGNLLVDETGKLFFECLDT